MLLILSFVYFAGIASCGMQGAQKAVGVHRNKYYILSSAFFMAFGGGLLRDILILNVFPAVFTIDCLPDVVVSLMFAIAYERTLEKKIKKPLHYFSVFSDALGLSQFISIGVDKALKLNGDEVATFFCGVITALGGGILLSMLCGEKKSVVFYSNIEYRMHVIIGTILYIVMIHMGNDRVKAQFLLAVYTGFTASFCNINKREYIERFLLRNLQYVQNVMDLYTLTRKKELLLNIVLCSQYNIKYIYKDNCYSQHNAPIQSKQISLLYHRILQK